MVMSTLLDKDKKEFRTNGIKRHWIVTSVDQVAADIKIIDKDKPPPQEAAPWTRDFKRMYTNLPTENIIKGVGKAIKEAIEYIAKTNGTDASKICFDFKYDRDGRATAEFTEAGTSYENLMDIIKHCCEDVVFCQGNDEKLLLQSSGLPMGSKCASELANLYCYSVESHFIDQLLPHNTEEAKKWYPTWRFIDDIHGLKIRKWETPNLCPNYGMDHTDTSEDIGKTAVFLGMKIEAKEEKRHRALCSTQRSWLEMVATTIH